MSESYMMRYVVYGNKQMLFSTVYRWFTKFSSGQESVKDAPYLGRPRSAITKSNINKIKIEGKAMIRNRYNYPTPPIRDIKGKETQTRNN